MGTPKRKTKRQKHLVLPRIDEKIKLLELGRETGQRLDIKSLPDILEEVKEVMLSLVPWLDKPIFPEAEFSDYITPKKFKRKRGLYLFESWAICIWLERSGMWFLRINRNSDRIFREVNSQQLAEIILDRSDDFLKQSLKEEDALEKIPSLKDIAIYDSIFLRFLSKFVGTVRALIEEREKRLCVMREWLNLLNDFAQSLDPLISQGKEISMKGYSIFSERGCRVNRFTQDYLCPEALEPFWEKLNARDPGDFRYKQRICEYMPKSLKDLLWRIDYHFEGIKKGVTEVDFLFGKNTGRLPFTDKELSVLKQLVDSVKA